MHSLRREFITKEILARGETRMSFADNSEPNSDAGFVRAYDSHAARRQFQVSLALVLVLGLAAMALGLLTQLDRTVAMETSSAVEIGSSLVAEPSPDIHS
jgi:hypothetical protein